MKVTSHEPLDANLRTTYFTIETEEPKTLQEVVTELYSRMNLSAEKGKSFDPGQMEPPEWEKDRMERIREEAKNSEFYPYKPDETGFCQTCQRMVDPNNHKCEGLQPHFYLKDLIDFDECPPSANWAAQDANGVIWFYETKPFLDEASGRWIGEGDTWYKHSVAQAIDWKKPLPRPN